LDYLLTLYRHRWTALSALAVVFVAVAVYTFTVTPEFEGRAQIQIDPDPNIVAFKQVSDLDKRSIEYFQTQLTILQSRALARKTIDGLNMWGDPEFVGERTGESKPAAADETAAQSLAIDTLLHRLSVEPIPDTRLVEVRVSSPTAAAAAKITNALVNTYIEQNLEQGSQSSRDATDWLSEQLALQRKKLEGSEQALQNYREQGNAIALDDRQNIVVQRLTDLNAAVTRARTDRLQKEAQYQQLARLQGNRAALETFPAIQSNGFIQSLKSQLSDLQRQRAQMSERLGENHPDMIKLATAIEAIEAKLQVEIEKSVESVRNQFLSAQAQERSLVGELERQKTDALALNRTGIEYDVLKREAASNKQIYETLMQRAKETGITRDLKSSNIRIVDLAEVPLRPVRPNKQVNLLLGLIVGALAGIGLAAFFEYLDNRIKNPDDIKRQLGLPFLGLVPTIQAKELQGTSPLLGSGVPVTFGEAMRGIRTNVQFSSAEEGSRSLVVTSSQPGEGKSVMASNLAVSFAQAGKRVLLVDADMRKPRQHDIFGVVSDPGLSNVIAGTAKAVDAVVKTPTQNLWLLPAGFIPPNPAELLGSARFAEILENLMAHFDWVVFDMPPVHAVTDASVIAHLMTGVVFVVGSEQTTRQSAQRAVEQLAGAQATILGAILNRVNVSSNPYYYAQQYRRAYGGYYTASGKRR
jgi:capsular exopolysaccharide synthesis family protein